MTRQGTLTVVLQSLLWFISLILQVFIDFEFTTELDTFVKTFVTQIIFLSCWTLIVSRWWFSYSTLYNHLSFNNKMKGKYSFDLNRMSLLLQLLKLLYFLLLPVIDFHRNSRDWEKGRPVHLIWFQLLLHCLSPSTWSNQKMIKQSVWS